MAYQKNVIQPVRVGGDSQALQLSRALKEVASGIDRFGKGFKKEYDEEQKAEAEKAARLDNYKSYNELADSEGFDKTKSKFWIAAYDNIKGETAGIEYATAKNVAFQNWWAENIDKEQEDLTGEAFTNWSAEYDQEYLSKIKQNTPYYLKGLERYIAGTNTNLGQKYASANAEKMKVLAENNILKKLESVLQQEPIAQPEQEEGEPLTLVISPNEINRIDALVKTSKLVSNEKFNELVVTAYKNVIAKIAVKGDENADYDRAIRLAEQLETYKRANGSSFLNAKSAASWSDFKQSLIAEKVEHEKFMAQVSTNVEFNAFYNEQNSILENKFFNRLNNLAGETDGRQKAAFATDEYKQRMKAFVNAYPAASLTQLKNKSIELRQLLEDKYEEAQIDNIRAFDKDIGYNVSRLKNNVQNAIVDLRADIDSGNFSFSDPTKQDTKGTSYNFLFTIARLNGFVDDKGNVGAQQIADAYEAYVAALKGIK